MEAAPLTRAHAHASKATHQQTLHNFKLASQEHKEAAEEFGKAEKETEDPESSATATTTPYHSTSYSNFVTFGESVHKLVRTALRTLTLLQQHHRDLSSRLLASTVQAPPTPPPTQTSFSNKDSTMAKPVTTTATTFSPPTSPKHRPPPLFGPDSSKPDSPNSEKPKMFFQPSTPTTPSTSDNPTHPSGTRKVAPPPIPLPSPTSITTQTLTYTSMRDGPVIPSPNPFALATELANARGIRSPVRGRSPAAGNDRNFLQVREPEPGARAASAGGTVRGTSPVLLGAPPRKERRKSAGAASPVVGPRDGLPFDNFNKDKPGGEGPIRPAVQEYDSSTIRSASPNPPKSDEAFTKFYSQFEEYIEAVGNPLAFAGLPLDGDLSSMDPALRKAVAEKGATESFYVVPTTGGTMSYAGILTRNQQQPASEKTEKLAAPATSAQPADKPTVSNKTREELELENTQLRQLTDIMAHKLHTWETSAKVNAAKMRESLQVLKETNHNSPVTDAFDADRGFGKSRAFGRSREPLKLGGMGGKTETQVLTLPDRASDLDMPSTPRLASRTLTLPGRSAVDEYEPPKTPRFGSGFPKDFDDDKPTKSNRAISPNPSGKSRGLSPLPGASKPRALSPAPSALSENPTMDELQAEIARLRQHETKILKENDKLKTVVGKYRDRWEKLKEGARARRAEQEGGDDTESIKSEATDTKSKVGA
ncbi:hypothetical protein H072_3629 [Dactylellina haptotyla CBS 200.50]|uniref:Uncharacterized protein n=1 Tax=Dactylellina haptotyla (strain CBS 200.50) TaxID=1284197 RepID=S8AMV4_DACHA|nr:hypothetical protein H072_3629 [Dactylellina haptotyla CBS 200.50]